MAQVKIYLHCVFATKNRQPILVKEKRSILFNHITEYAKEKKIDIDSIGGFDNHIHLLISLGSTQSIADVMHFIKGESSWWANKEGLFDATLTWAKSYYCASINKRSLGRVRSYIQNQESHHQRTSFDSEWSDFMKDNEE